MSKGKKKAPAPAHCRPSEVARGLIDDAKKLGKSESGFLNELVETYGEQHLKRVAQDMSQVIRQLLAA